MRSLFVMVLVMLPFFGQAQNPYQKFINALKQDLKLQSDPDHLTPKETEHTANQRAKTVSILKQFNKLSSLQQQNSRVASPAHPIDSVVSRVQNPETEEWANIAFDTYYYNEAGLLSEIKSDSIVPNSEDFTYRKQTYQYNTDGLVTHYLSQTLSDGEFITDGKEEYLYPDENTSVVIEYGYTNEGREYLSQKTTISIIDEYTNYREYLSYYSNDILSYGYRSTRSTSDNKNNIEEYKYQYDYNTNEGKWSAYQKIYRTYDEQRRQTEFIRWYSNSAGDQFESSIKHTFSFTEDGMDKTENHYSRANDEQEWALVWTVDFLYNQGDSLYVRNYHESTGVHIKEFELPNDEGSEIFVFTYESTEPQHFSGTENTKDAQGRPTLVKEYMINDNQQKDYERQLAYEYYDNTELIKTKITQPFNTDNGQWENYSKSEYDYVGEKESLHHYFMWDNNTEDWVLKSKFEETFYEDGGIKSRLREEVKSYSEYTEADEFLYITLAKSYYYSKDRWVGLHFYGHEYIYPDGTKESLLKIDDYWNRWDHNTGEWYLTERTKSEMFEPHSNAMIKWTDVFDLSLPEEFQNYRSVYYYANFDENQPEEEEQPEEEDALSAGKSIKISIYPNPAQSHLQIKSEINIEAVSIINSAGQTIRAFDQALNSYSVEGLPAGIYTVVVKSQGKQYSKRFIKE
ncbi:hypothetical protein PEPS_15070 [Persicobacter psychrovividus]|uniref:Secretion system C-terminal sorting domain-containing protein n=2 Tax=Persicobacter psychrovividus TaxID=387638 RepID=A0ABM7VEW0_9BACT|nr:hypothetical protein PEPS_15070 [Persicobacter psychrovividus]